MTEFSQIPLGLIRFDPKNPRFPSTLDGTNEEVILRFMLDDAGIIDLMRSIAAQGFFVGEPLLVTSQPDGTFLAIEGNRRLAAAKLLANPSSAPARRKAVQAVADSATEIPETLPVLEFANRPAILRHLGYRHVTGIKEWDPLAKARFLRARYEEHTVSDSPLRDIARTIGSRADYVGRLLVALRLYEIAESRNFFGIDELSEAAIDFSLITSMLAYSPIVSFVGLSNAQDVSGQAVDEGRLEFLLTVAFKRNRGVTRLGESRNIRLLADVVQDDAALAAFRTGDSLIDAHALTEQAELGFASLLAAAEKSLRRAEGLRPTGTLQRPEIDKLQELRSLIENLLDDEIA